jgi:hypothetical protein
LDPTDAEILADISFDDFKGTQLDPTDAEIFADISTENVRLVLAWAMQNTYSRLCELFPYLALQGRSAMKKHVAYAWPRSGLIKEIWKDLILESGRAQWNTRK